mgnify:CR=1 FL=1
MLCWPGEGIWQGPEEGIGVGNDEERYTRGNDENSDEFVWRCKDKSKSWTRSRVVRGVWGESWCAPGMLYCCHLFLRSWSMWLRRMWEMVWWVRCCTQMTNWFWWVKRWTGGTEGEVLEMEGGIWEQGAEGEPREDKSGSEWGRRWSICKVDPCGICGKRVMAIQCCVWNAGNQDPWKMCKSKKGDPKLGREHGGLWVQIPSGARIFSEFLLVSTYLYLLFYLKK